MVQKAHPGRHARQVKPKPAKSPMAKPSQRQQPGVERSDTPGYAKIKKPPHPERVPANALRAYVDAITNPTCCDPSGIGSKKQTPTRGCRFAQPPPPGSAIPPASTLHPHGWLNLTRIPAGVVPFLKKPKPARPSGPLSKKSRPRTFSDFTVATRRGCV